MDLFSAGHPISTIPTVFPVRFPSIPVRASSLVPRLEHFRITVSSKQPDFRDYQRFAVPTRLLPAQEVKICTGSSPEEFDGSQSMYKIRLQTSKTYGSCLSDIGSGILVCFIGENGDSILQRISTSLMYPTELESRNTLDDTLPFRRGSINEFAFMGPNLGKFEALWVGLESGQWRLGGLSLTVINRTQPLHAELVGQEIRYFGVHYDFDTDDVLLGEGSDLSMVELRPCLINEFSEVDELMLWSKTIAPSELSTLHETSNEESMKEYADLKFSLLLYDGMLIFSSTSITSILVGDKAALACLVGSVSGLLYLLLLQKSVDELPAPASNYANGLFQGFTSPISSLALAFGFAIVAVKYGLGVAPAVLTPQELIAAMLGFLTCKVAVVLAAFRPLPRGLEEN